LLYQRLYLFGLGQGDLTVCPPQYGLNELGKMAGEAYAALGDSVTAARCDAIATDFQHKTTLEGYQEWSADRRQDIMTAPINSWSEPDTHLASEKGALINTALGHLHSGSPERAARSAWLALHILDEPGIRDDWPPCDILGSALLHMYRRTNDAILLAISLRALSCAWFLLAYDSQRQDAGRVAIEYAEALEAAGRADWAICILREFVEEYDSRYAFRGNARFLPRCVATLARLGIGDHRHNHSAWESILTSFRKLDQIEDLEPLIARYFGPLPPLRVNSPVTDQTQIRNLRRLPNALDCSRTRRSR